MRTNSAGLTLVLAANTEEAARMLAAATYAANAEYRLAVSPLRLVKLLSVERVSCVLARRLSELGTTKSQLVRVLELLREQGAELSLTEQELAMQDLEGAFEVFDALAELQARAIRKGIERSPCRSGRPLKDFDVAKAANMRSGGASYSVISKVFNVAESTVRRRLSALENDASSYG